MKWGTLYGADYVNVLFNAVQANMTGPFRMVCLTDDATGIDPGVTCHPIPELGIDKSLWISGGWPKLSVFASGIPDVTGRCLFLDLDIVVAGPLDDLFTYAPGLSMIREWPRFADLTRKTRDRGCSAVLAFDADGQRHILDRFLDDPQAATRAYRQEQQYLQAHAEGLNFFPSSWMISFKRNLMAKPIADRFIAPKPITDDARVLVFHGVPRPIDVVPDRNQRWGKGWHYGRGAVPYVRDYWLRHGGTDPK